MQKCTAIPIAESSFYEKIIFLSAISRSDFKMSKKLRIIGNNVFFPHGFNRGEIIVENGKITSVCSNADASLGEEIIDFGNSYVLPGFIDIHTHGALNFDFCNCTTEEIIKAAAYHLSFGTTTIIPTITSSTFEKTCKALEKIEKVMRSGKAPNIAGAHLEGPYFSEKQCGAQDKSLITAPIKNEYEKIVDSFGGIIKRWDYAPERDVGGEFASYLTSHGILPSAGHTDAIYDDMVLARENGCRLITHLYSCTSTITRINGFRRLGVTECAYLWDDIYIEIIADGKHLPPELLQLIFKLKQNEKIILVTDSLKATGCKGKKSTIGNTECIIEDGVCKLADKSAFAGSIATTDKLLRVCVKDADIDFSRSIKALTENPARLFGLNAGLIAEGKDADFVVLNDKLEVRSIISKGVKIK